jgi:hypothetical protein
MKHTPGKWKLERDGYNPYILDSSMLVRIADICRIEGTGIKGSTEGNAHLIAAAPELLEACKKALGVADLLRMKIGYSGQKKVLCDILRAAISKAEGDL